MSKDQRLKTNNQLQNMHLIIYGPEGSGKGTQAQLISHKYNVPVYTSGDLVRGAALNDKSQIGDKCRTALDSGKYVDDNTIISLWQDKLNTPQAKNGFILDGFPRNVSQAEFLHKVIESLGYDIDRFIHLNIDDEETYERLSKRNRKVFEGSNKLHDTPELIAKRLAEYHSREKDILDFYVKKGIILEVDGKGSIEEIFERITKGLG